MELKNLLTTICEFIDNNDIESLNALIANQSPAELADIIESLPPDDRNTFWELIPQELDAEILPDLNDEVYTSLVRQMDDHELLNTAGQMEDADLADMLETLPVNVSDALLNRLDDEHRQRLERVMSFEEDSAGRLMSSDVISVHDDVSLAVVLRYLRRHSTLPPQTDTLMVTDDEGRFLGKLELGDLLTGNPEQLVSDIMISEAASVHVNESEHNVAALFERRDLISIAVVDDDNRLLGRITIDDIIDVVRAESDSALMKSAGLREDEDLFAPVFPSAKRRGVWLGINLVTVFFAAWVIGRFEEVLDQLVALAVLMPIVASMGGIAGSQTLTLTIRGLALDQIATANIGWLTSKELQVGALNGIVWSIVVGCVSFLWFDNLGLGIVIGVAMILNLLIASLSGVIIPLVLHKMKIDPALSGAVILTTVTDVAGFLTFLGLATLYLLP